MTAVASGLDAKVLVLNRMYAVIRVVDARRAFSLLAKQVAEIIAIENGAYRNYDLATWADLGALQQQFEREEHDWVRTTRVGAWSSRSRRSSASSATTACRARA